MRRRLSLIADLLVGWKNVPIFLDDQSVSLVPVFVIVVVLLLFMFSAIFQHLSSIK